MPPTPGHLRLAAELAVGAHFASHARHFPRESVELIHHGVDGVLQLEDLAAHIDGDLLREIAVGDGGGDIGNVADLRRQIAGHRVDAVGEILPRARNAAHVGLTAEFALRPDFARDTGHLSRRMH